MTVNEFFPHKVCINLDRRSDRWAQVRSTFARHSIDNVIRFAAIDGNEIPVPTDWEERRGAYGCMQSHLAVVCEAREKKAPSILVFEDDVVFDRGFSEKFPCYIKDLPANWDMLLFGGVHNEPPINLSDHIVRVTETTTTHAYAFKHTIYDAFIELNSKALNAVDVNNTILQKEFYCYCLAPNLAGQEQSYSDVASLVAPFWI